MENTKNPFKSMFTMYSGLPKEIYILFLGKFITCVGAFISPLLTLILTQKIGLSTNVASKFIALTSVCQIISTLIGGKLVDKIGRKKVMVIFPTISSILFLICGLMPISHILIIFILLGCIFASISNCSYDSMVADVTNEENRKNSYSLIYMGLNLGYAVGPLLGGLLFENHFALIFIGDAATTLISCLFISCFIKETYVNHNKENHDNAKVSSLETSVKGSLFKVLLQRPILIFYFLITILFSFTYSQMGFSLPLRLQELFDSNGSSNYGLLAGWNAILVLLLTPAVSLMTKRLKIINIISIGGLLYAIGFALFGYSANILLFFISMTIVSIGEIAISTNSGTLINNLTPASHRGRINSLAPLMHITGNVLGTIIIGGSIDVRGSSISFYIIGMVSLIGALGMYLLNYMKVQSS